MITDELTTVRRMTVKEAFFTLLRDNGVKKLFGNPGTTELGLLTALGDVEGLDYVMGLHDATAVGMAHGHWLATGSLAAVNLHATPGISSAMGNIYNAYRSGVPLLVTAGQVDQRMQIFEPPLFGDMISMMQPITKWAWEVSRPEQIVPAMHRAIRTAMAYPQGPVFLSLPMNVVDEMVELPARTAVAPTSVAQSLAPEAVREVATLLRAAKSPILIVGESLNRSGAWRGVEAVAELVNARIFNERVPPTMPVHSRHPLYQGPIGFSAASILENLRSADLIVVAGASRIAPIVYGSDWTFDVAAKVVQVDEVPDDLGRVLPYDIALVGPLEVLFGELHALLGGTGSVANGIEARKPVETPVPPIADPPGHVLTAADVVDELAIALPDAMIVDEALTSSRAMLSRFPLQPGGYYGINGTSLGWGLPAAIGAQMAMPERRVVAFIGDGAALYAIQSLWSAAHYDVPITVVIVNNKSYRILKEGSEEAGANGLELDIRDPNIGYQALADSFGVEARQVTDRAGLRDALAWSNDKRPCVIEVLIDPAA